VLFPAFVLLAGIPGRVESWTVLGRLGANAVILVLLFAGWPSALAWLRRIHWRGAFGWYRPSIGALAGAACLGVSLWPFIYELIRLVSGGNLHSIAERFPELTEEINRAPLPWKLITLALVPAVCEELFFRGFLFQSMRSTVPAWQTILLTAALFGLFHVLVGDELLLIRFLPTTLMGLVLGWVCHRAGSVLPGMLLHAIHNCALLTVDRWFPTLNPEAASASTSVGGMVLTIAGTIAAIGVGLIVASRRPMEAQA
jgi:membrane protease YdiL (CAAX protease family)